MRRFFAPKGSFTENTARLDEIETRHLRDVLRLRSGDEISVFDGEGKEFHCRIDKIGKKETTVAIVKSIEPSAPESPLHLTLASVVLPGDKYDLIVQKSVELGIVRFIPIASVRSEIKLKDMSKKLARWRRIALDASKQCGRARLMTIESPQNVREFLNAQQDEAAAKIFFSERDGKRMPELNKTASIIAVIGPKGGWDDDEIEAACSNDFSIVTFGGRIMRAETAAIALGAVLQHRFGDLN